MLQGTGYHLWQKQYRLSDLKSYARERGIVVQNTVSLLKGKPAANVDYAPFGRSDKAFGFPGAGGSFAFADPDAQVGFAYAMNKVGGYMWDDPREKSLRDAFYRCLDKIG